MDDEYFDDYLDDSEDAGERCRTCESYQEQIYALNVRLRANLSSEEYQDTKRQLDGLVQVQLRHQREHL